MLSKIDKLPTDKRIAGVHCVPLLEGGSLVMVWDKDEQVLTTVGGRIEGNESIEEALNREAMEEAGIMLETNRKPFASWYWDETDTYTIYFIAKVEQMFEIPEGFEKTGRVTFNFETARQIVRKVEGRGERIQILTYAEEAATTIE
ncbi:NUDIX hydrolase [Paenibacillus gorillae]|uniref:NUDIX hydrolase n=1 Tax=Paenibacillus gorillae TaxID=1243662 RepID=UPI0004BBF78D|nr:NUDIX domain-containing protein [Paenibacillus gorillae]